MTFIYKKFNKEIVLENKLNFIQFDNTNQMYEFGLDINKDKNEDEFYIVDDKNKQLKFGSCVGIITDVFTLDINDKKILTKLYKKIQVDFNEDDNKIYDAERVIREASLKLLEEINSKVSIPLTYDDDFELAEFFKLFNLKINFNDNNLIFNVTNYIEVMLEFYEYKIIIIPFISNILSSEDIKKLLEFATQHDLYILSFANLNNKFDESKDDNVIVVEDDIIL
ncbi:MAG: type II-A CRISPR-associated protein Csn2 [Mycoplasmataceae bacterium]|jgi:CRISPR-associated protein Csn2|nr:type II-A CRISPR-associated protein Csn2 [Mycoplasmataceae bacterium]